MRKVITYGTFDLLHQGHINLLKRAKASGDYLIVGVTSANYDRYRGKLNVRQSVSERMDAVRKLPFVDEVIVEEYEGQKIDDIIRLHVDAFVIGSDWVGRFDYLKDYCEVIYLERTRGISSTQLRNAKHPIIRMGVVGTGRIANRFLQESKFVSGITVEGVFNIHEDSAKRFAEKHELAFYEVDYDRFLDKINAVYIASPHDTHFAYAKHALLSGKNVLCEKPMAFSGDEVDELFSIAEAQGLILMEAIKTAYCPGFQRLISCAKSGKIGDIVGVDAAFTKLVPMSSRELRDDPYSGSVTELITYPLLAIFRLLGTDYEDLHFTSYYRKGHVADLYTRLILDYPGAAALAVTGLGVKSEGELIISGTRGYVYVPAPWWKTEYFELRYEDPSENEKNFYKFAGDGLRYELVEFISQILSGKMPAESQTISRAIADVIAVFRAGKRTRVLLRPDRERPSVSGT